MAMLKTPVTDDDHIIGDPKAPITLLQYGDYECPACGLAFPIVERIRKYYGKKLRFVFRNFPLTEVHPHAESAAETAEFAARHDRFWEMHDLLYLNQARLDLPTYLEFAKTLKLSEKELESALKNGTFREKIKNDFLGGVYSGVNGTPTFFINGNRHDGPFGYQDLMNAIDHLLVRE